MNKFQVSVIQGHNKYPNTDILYAPLRKTFQMDTTKLQSRLEQLSQYSQFNHPLKTRTHPQNIKLGYNTFIPQDRHLKPTNNISKVNQNRPYNIINAQQKLSKPITQQQLNQATQNGHTDQIIVYTVTDDSSSISNKTNKIHELSARKQSKQDNLSTNNKIRNSRASSARQPITQHPLTQIRKSQIRTKDKPIPEPPLIQTRKSITMSKDVPPIYKKLDMNNLNDLEEVTIPRPKYNLFSAIDQPVNSMFSGEECRCPENSIIAEQITEVSWYSFTRQ